MPRATAASPTGLLDTTARAAIGFAGGPSNEAGLASGAATSLAKGVLHAMTISKRKILGATALACGFAWGGAPTFGQSGGPGGSENPKGVTASARAASRLADAPNPHPAPLSQDQGFGPDG